ncbi:MAG TPA: GMC family oxidoreductase N-terminal domain-containing protein, partial [Pseudonocardia sp.]
MYDYVIVGSGAAGSVIAARLSEDPDVSVLVLEAGPMDSSPLIETPLMFGQLFKSRYDWDLCTEPEPGLDGRSIYLAQGRVVGGSTSVNAMVYMRGSPADYDEWAADGATGWAYPDVLPYFRRAEDNERGASRFHGAGGPLRVSENRSRHPLAAAFLDAAWQAGIPKNADVNGAEQEGVHWHQVTQRDGRRCSAAAAYLHPALRHRRNLTLLANSPALRLLWPPGPARGRVTGVEYLRDGRVARASAAREVIVCAGTYQSAVLLMVSGIGPADQLRSLGIEAGQDLPVGENLQDHIMTCLVYHTDEISLLGAFSPEN